MASMTPKEALRAFKKDHDGYSVAHYIKCHPDDTTTFSATWLGDCLRASDVDSLKRSFELCFARYKEDEPWLAPLLGVFASRLRRAAGKEQASTVKETFDSAFRSSMKAKEEEGKLVVELLLLTEMMKIFASLNSDSSTKNLVRTVENPNFPPLERFTAARRITYAFYVGRYAVLEDDPAAGAQMLEFAYRAVKPIRHERNQTRILEYLIPCRLALGNKPPKVILDEINARVPVLGAVVRAIGAGNARLLMSILNGNARYFSSRGTYAMLCKTRFLACRNLVKICVQVYRSICDPTEKNKVPLGKLYPSFRVRDDYDETDDLEDHVKCVLANLIAIGLIKGYVSFDRDVLVLSANDAFPKTTQMQIGMF